MAPLLRYYYEAVSSMKLATLDSVKLSTLRSLCSRDSCRVSFGCLCFMELAAAGRKMRTPQTTTESQDSYRSSKSWQTEDNGWLCLLLKRVRLETSVVHENFIYLFLLRLLYLALL